MLVANDKSVVTKREVGKRDRGIKRDLTPFFTLPTLISHHRAREQKFASTQPRSLENGVRQQKPVTPIRMEAPTFHSVACNIGCSSDFDDTISHGKIHLQFTLAT